MQQRVTIITLGVSDLQIATQFYTETLDWETTEGSNEFITFFRLNGVLFSLYPIEKLAEDAKLEAKPLDFRGFTLAHNLHSEKEVDEFFEKLSTKGVRIVKQPEKVNWGGYSGYFSDPDGNLWEVAFNPFLPLDENGNI